jgi:hypothetical protein
MGEAKRRRARATRTATGSSAEPDAITTTVPDMIAELRALPTPPTIEQRDVDELPERSGL